MKSIVKIALVTSIAFFGYASCKKGLSNKKQVLEQTTTNELPKELKNTIWLSKKDDETYLQILDRGKRFPESIVKFDDKNVFLELNEQGEYAPLLVDSILVSNKGYSIILDGFFVGKIDFVWKDKIKGVAALSITYNNYRGQGTEVHNSIRVEKRFVTPENFPQKQQKVAVISEEGEIDSNYLNIEKLPVLGKFHCAKGGPEGYYEARLKLSNDELILFDEEGNILENQPYTVELTIDEHITTIGLNCSLKLIENSPNKYAVFFKYLTEDTKTTPQDILYYSKTHPIAEIEILDNNTIKKKWLGIYNRRTKKVEDYGQQYAWDDKCDGVITRVDQF